MTFGCLGGGAPSSMAEIGRNLGIAGVFDAIADPAGAGQAEQPVARTRQDQSGCCDLRQCRGHVASEWCGNVVPAACGVAKDERISVPVRIGSRALLDLLR